MASRARALRILERMDDGQNNEEEWRDQGEHGLEDDDDAIDNGEVDSEVGSKEDSGDDIEYSTGDDTEHNTEHNTEDDSEDDSEGFRSRI